MSNDPQQPGLPAKGQFLVYPAEDGRVKIEVRLENETVWLTQQHLADLFQTSKQNVGQHLNNIFEEGELAEDSVVKNFFTTAADGKKYRTNHYNLDAIISVGYRVKSAVATRFRIWATQKLREYIVKGFVLDDDRLKNPDQPFDYFDELLRNPNGIESISPGLARSDYPGWTKMCDTTPTGLHRARHARRCNPFRVGDISFTISQGSPCRATLGWMMESRWDSPACNILTHTGKISHEMAKELSEAEYEKFNSKRIQKADQAGGDFEKAIKQLPPPPKPKKKGGKK
ncbi:MAG: RhuM family protein [Verrucomicrobiota bacterium]